MTTVYKKRMNCERKLSGWNFFFRGIFFLVQPAVGSGVNEGKKKTRSFARGMLAAAVL